MTTLKQLNKVFTQIIKLPELRLKTVDIDGNLTWETKVNGEPLYCVGQIHQPDQQYINVYQYKNINFVIAGRPHNEYAVAYQPLQSGWKFVSRFDLTNQPIEIKKAVKILDLYIEGINEIKFLAGVVTEYRGYKQDLLENRSSIASVIEQITHKAKCLYFAWGETERTTKTKSIYDDTVKILEKNCLTS